MKPSRIFLRSKFSTACHFFQSRLIQQLLVHYITASEVAALSLRQ